MIDKALAAGADEVVVDLEDAVAPADKTTAREVIRSYPWDRHEELPLVAIRVNAARTPWCHRDLELVVDPGIPASTVVLPKVESRADLDFAERLLDGLEAETGGYGRLGIQALIETAAGLQALAEVVARPDRHLADHRLCRSCRLVGAA